MAWNDLLYAARALRRTPILTAVAVLMLAVATSTSTVVFSVVDTVILRSPFDQPDSIAVLHIVKPDGRQSNAVPRDIFEQLVERPPSPVVVVSDWTISNPAVTGIDTPRRGGVECVSASMATVLGTVPLRGRWFTPEEDQPGGPAVGLASYNFWTSALGADPNVVGRPITVDGTSVTIVGVMPPGFDGALSRIKRDLWVPLGQVTTAEPRYGCGPPRATLNAVVRLRPGASIDAGVDALNGLLPEGTDVRLGLTPIAEQTLGYLQGPFVALVGAVIALLLIAGANAAHLGLERVITRRREIAVRFALGATPSRVIRQILIEHMITAASGAALGVLLSILLLDAVVAMLPANMPRADTVALNGRVLVASISGVLLCGLGAGLISALHVTRGRLLAGSAGSDRGYTAGGRTVRRALVVFEVALGVMLLVGALLMVRTFLTLHPSEPGFDPSHKLIVELRRPSTVSAEQHMQFLEDVKTELLRTPGVRAVALTTYVLMSGSANVAMVSVEGAQAPAFSGSVAPNYFDVMQIPIRRGRTFSDADRSGAPVAAIVNEAFVRRWLPDREPVGVHISTGGVAATIVGVSQDTRAFAADTAPRPELYFPIAQVERGTPSFVIHAEAGALATLPAAFRDLTSRLSPGQLIDRVQTYESLLASQVGHQRLGAWLFGVFAGIAVLLAAIGLGATLAWSVSQRQREIGVRMALGAPIRHVRGLVLVQTLVLAGGGVVLGLGCAALTTQLLQGWLFGVTPLDAPTFVACGGLMMVVALLAAYLPARRATRIDPLTALRAE